MNYREFCEWLKEQDITLEFSDLGGNPGDTLVFVKEGERFFNVPNVPGISYEEVRNQVICELNNIMSEVIYDVILVTEAAEMLGKEPSAFRKALDTAIRHGRIIEGKDFRKASSTWLLRRSAVRKVYPNAPIISQ